MENRPEIALQHRGFSRPCNTGRGTRRVGDATSGTAALIHTCADRLNEAGRQRAAGIPERRVAPSVAPRDFAMLIRRASAGRIPLTERRRNRTFQPWGCHGLPVLKTGWATRPLPLR